MCDEQHISAVCSLYYFSFYVVLCIYMFLFFFQAEDGIRDTSVTGVQTCALPISRPAHQARRRGGAGQARPLQPPVRRLRRQEIPEPGRLPLGSDQRGQPRLDPGGPQVRRDQRHQVHLLRRVVDSAGDPPGPRRAVAHRGRAAQPGRHAASHRQALGLAPARARPRADRGRDRRRHGYLRGGSRQDTVHLAGAPLPRRTPDPGRGQQAARLPPRHDEPRTRRSDLRARAHRVDRGSAGDAQGARGQNPQAVFRPRGAGAHDAGGDRLAARHHARAGAANQGKGPGAPPSRLESQGAGKLPVLAPGRVHYRPMAALASFDISTGADLQEVDNAVNQATKEVAQRYDFKGSKASIAFDRAKVTLTLVADDDFKMKALFDVLQTKLVKRGVPVKNLELVAVTPAANDTVRREITLTQGIPQEKAKAIVKAIKDKKFKKAQASIQGTEIRVQSPSKDELQEVMAFLRTQDWGIELKFGNYRG